MPNFINQIVKTVVKFIFFCPADGRIFVCVIFYIPNPSLNFCAIHSHNTQGKSQFMVDSAACGYIPIVDTSCCIPPPPTPPLDKVASLASALLER